MAEELFTDIINNLGKTKIKAQGSGSKSGKTGSISTGDRSAIQLPKGITSDSQKIDITANVTAPITDKFSILGDIQYNKFRDKIEKGNQELFLQDTPSNVDRKVGIGYNEGGEGVSGYAKYGIDSEKPEYFVQYKKSFEEGGQVRGSRTDLQGNRIPSKTNSNSYSFKNGKWTYVARQRIQKGEPGYDANKPKEKRVLYEAKPGETPNEFVERIKKTSKENILKGSQKGKIQSNQARELMNEWTKDYLDKNLKKYSLREADEFLDVMKTDYKTWVNNLEIPEIRRKDGTVKLGNSNFFTPDELPNISRSTASNQVSDIFEYEGFKTVNEGKFGGAKTTNQVKNINNTSFLRKVFLRNKIRTTDGLLKKIEDQFDYITTNKRELKGKLKYANFQVDPDVKYLLDPNQSKLNFENKNSVIKSFGDKFFNKYKLHNKRIKSGVAWHESARIIEEALGEKEMIKLTGNKKIKNSMDLERRAMNKIFQISNLPESLRKAMAFTLDHAQGLKAAASSGNKDLMRLAVTDLIGTTGEANTKTGFGYRNKKGKFIGPERLRVKYMNNIKNGTDIQRNVNLLNDLMQKYYGKKEVYNIKNNRLVSSPISSATDGPQRQVQYIEKLMNNPESRKVILEKSKTTPELKKLVDKVKVDNKTGLYSFPAQVENIKIPSALKTIGRAFKNILGPLAVVAEPVFMTMDATEAVEKGAKPLQTAEYVGDKLLQELINMPEYVTSGVKYASDYLQGKGEKAGPFDYLETKPKFKTGTLYKPLSVAEKRLQKNLDSNISGSNEQRQVDVEFRKKNMGNLTDVDIMETPASKDEIEKAKRQFRIANGVPAEDMVKLEGIETLKKRKKLNLQPSGIFSIRSDDPYDV